MSSTTKKAPIDPKSKEYAESLLTTTQMYHQLSEYERSIKEENDIKKRKIASEISKMGDVYIDEIDRKHQEKENERLDMIDYVIHNTKENIIKVKELKNMPYEDVKSIYIKAKDYKKSWWRLFIEFIMGW